MCGIVAAVAERNVMPILLEGLKRLEYRGYDSAGLAFVQTDGIHRERAVGKVANLAEKSQALTAQTGIAHTRWATHGKPSEENTHPHMSGDKVVLVHNGIIENHNALRARLQEKGYVFQSQTDTEVIAHLLAEYYRDDLLQAVRQTVAELEGAFALAICVKDKPDEVVVVQHGAPMVLGVGLGEMFAASDTFALLPVTRRFVYLHEGDFARITRNGYHIENAQGEALEREAVESGQSGEVSDKGGYKHFMQKEIFEQPAVIAETLEGRILHDEVNLAAFDDTLLTALEKTKQIHIVACGTSYHAGLAMRYAFEASGYPVSVEVASEYVYRSVAVPDNTLFIAISQSGETADTLAAVKKAKALSYLSTLAICNVADSAIVRACDSVLMTRAGREISVASTKAFVTQYVVLQLLHLLLSSDEAEKQRILQGFRLMSGAVDKVLQQENAIAQAAKMLDGKHGTLYLGRGELYPIALEGALKLKELSYIQAEAYPAGELKHGTLALVDDNMTVIALLAKDALADKMHGNLQEVQARGGNLLVFADDEADTSGIHGEIVRVGKLDGQSVGICMGVAMQLLAYHTALRRGTDIDQPRNLAKSVTVE